MDFPSNFVWGAAAAAYQIEGAAFADGKGLSVWDMLCRQPGKIFQAQSGEVACDHYHRFEEDVALMKQIGLQAYRLSISWPRVLPEGAGAINPKGLDFYDRLIDALLGAGIEPWVTLFHWDFPYALYLRGGWLNPESPRWFADYAQVIVDRLSDRVAHWMTLNEPQCFIGLGHLQGNHAPGLKMGLEEVLLAGHHVLLAHGRAVQIIRAGAVKPPSIGWAPVGLAGIPASTQPPDLDALRQHVYRANADGVWNNIWWGDPVVLGHYPEAGLQAYGPAVPKFTDEEMRTICQPLDFYGANIYGSPLIRAGADGKMVESPHSPGEAMTAYGWDVTPGSLYWGPKLLQERYHLPIVVTENGMSNTDWVGLDGCVHDPQRIDFLKRHLLQLRKAISEGIDVRGYFHWSIMDNFEWSQGYKQRFGLIHVDFVTQARTLKDSAFWYKKVIESRSLE